MISLSGVAVEFGATVLFEDVNFTVAKGDRWGIIGRNGSGKTTLFNLITGALQPTKGIVSRAGSPRITVLDQHRAFEGAHTVWEAAAGPFSELLALEQSLQEQAMAIGERGERSTEQILARYDRDLERFDREGGYTFAPRVDAVLHGLGFDPIEARTRPLEQLSGGERGRVGLARQLVAPAEVLLLDEPTNHLDLETTDWLAEYLRELDATILIISHDRAFLEEVVDHVVHVESRTTTSYVGDYISFVQQRTERRLSQNRAFEQQSKKVASEEDFIRRNIAGQKSKQAKGRRKRLERMPRLSPPPGEQGVMGLRLEVRERGGDQVLVAEDVALRFGERTLVEGFSTRVLRGEVIGLIGPNGTGKSTLLRGIAGEQALSEGELRLGLSTQLAYYQQDLAQVPTGVTLFSIIHDLRPLWDRGQVQNHLGRFGFSGDSVLRSADTLSGGERARVALAMMMLSGANLLMIDEPTNHLDVESIEALEDAIESFDGTVLLVSHDRALLRALVKRVWILHDQHITDFTGTFAEWEAVSSEREHAARLQASEEEALRKVREKKNTRAQSSSSGSKDSTQQLVRAARKELEDAEADVARFEAEISRLSAALEDPKLYTTTDGARRATEMGKQLDAVRKKLDAALERWTKASDALEN
jgi:ATP-binding cassette subfamily F protein 3